MSNEVEQWKQRAEKAEAELAVIKGTPWEQDRKKLVDFLQSNWPDLTSVDAWPADRTIALLRLLFGEKQRFAVACAELRNASLKLTDEIWAHVPEEQWRNPPVLRALEHLQNVRKQTSDCGKDYIHRDVAVNKLADAFIACPLPDSVCSDQCACIRGYKHRSGTNLLTVEEARQMFSQILETLRKESK